MDVERVAPFNVLHPVYPEIPIAYKPNKRIEIENRFELALLINKFQVNSSFFRKESRAKRMAQPKN